MAQARRSGKHIGRPAPRKFHADEIGRMRLLRSQGMSGFRCCDQSCTSLTRTCKLSPRCEATSDERSAGSLHATFCGSRGAGDRPRRPGGEPGGPGSTYTRTKPETADRAKENLTPASFSPTRKTLRGDSPDKNPAQTWLQRLCEE